MYSSIWQILTSLSANSKWPSHIIVPVWWTVLVSSKAEKRRWGHRTRAPLQAFSGPRKGKQQLTLLTFLDSIICFFTKSYITGKTTGPCCRANQNRDISPTVTGSKCRVLTVFVSQLSRRFDTKHRNHGCLKGQKTPVLLSATLGKLTVLASCPVVAV